MRLLIPFLLAIPLVAGQDIVLSSQTASNSLPALPQNSTLRFETSFNTWGTPTQSQVPMYINAGDGLECYWQTSPSPLTFLCFFNNQSGGAGANCAVTITTQLALSLRIQQIPSGAGGSVTCQFWDQTGTEIVNLSSTYTGTTGTVFNGVQIGGTTAPLNYSYIRLCPSTVAVVSTPPTTAESQTGCYFQNKFDLGNNTGSLTDSTGNGYIMTLSGGSPTYANTPYQVPPYSPVANLITCGAPPWTTWLSLFVNQTGCISASNSYSQADASPTVSCVLSNTSGPATPTIVSSTSCTSNLTGISAFGAYTFGVVVTDASSNTASTSLTAGAVSVDSNCIVQNTDPNVDKIFDGPMIGFGCNPWSYADEREMTAVNLQIANNAYYTDFVQNGWGTNGQGTVSYNFNTEANTPATLNGGITATATSIAISTAQNIPSLAACTPACTNPVGLLIGGKEFIRITASTATTGNATLTVAYDGRGIDGTPWGNFTYGAAQIWSSGTAVYDIHLAGSGTKFVTDSNRPLAPAGVPGPMGPIEYTTGHVQLAASSMTVTGVGTTFASPTTQAGYMILVHATHNSGMAFNWWAQITTINSTTSLTVDRNAPSDVDVSTNFTYAILGPLYLSLNFTDTVWGNSTKRLLQNGAWCESETDCYFTPGHDIVAFDTASESAQNYSYINQIGATSQFGPEYYCTSCAERQFYYRSGYTPALTAANQIDDYFIRDPELAGGWAGGDALLVGPGTQGGLSNLVLNGSTLLSWNDYRQSAQAGLNWVTTYATNCNTTGSDTRDQAYIQLPLANGSLYDPNSTDQGNWLTGAGLMLTRDQMCHRGDYSYASSPGLQGPSISLTHGSAAVTGTGFVSTDCLGVAAGTITVTNGSTAASFTLSSGSLSNTTNLNLVFTDTTSSPAVDYFLEFSFSGSSITLAAVYPGMSGTYNFVAQTNTTGGGGYDTSIGDGDGTDNDNTRQSEGWACTYNSPTSLTLHRPWDDSVTGGTIHPSGTYTLYPVGNFGVQIGGYYQQPFMLGIKAYEMSRLAYNSSSGTIRSGYITLLGPTSTWYETTGFDPNTSGTNYARVQRTCEPGLTSNTVTLFENQHGTAGGMCDANGLLGGQPGQNPNEFVSRVDSIEAFPLVIEYFKSQCLLGNTQCSVARTFGDLVYGAIFGEPSFTTAGYYSDIHYVNTQGELSNVSLGAYKWTGFFFGMGGNSTNTWPAIRLQYQPATQKGISSGKGISAGIQ